MDIVEEALRIVDKATRKSMPKQQALPAPWPPSECHCMSCLNKRAW